VKYSLLLLVGVILYGHVMQTGPGKNIVSLQTQSPIRVHQVGHSAEQLKNQKFNPRVPCIIVIYHQYAVVKK